MIPPKKHQQEENVDSWLMSYADMITLLLGFFIIFVSVSEPKNDKFSLITDGLANKFGSVDLSTPFEGVFRSLQETIEKHQVFKDVAVVKTERSIDMELSAGTFFKDNSAEINPDKLAVLDEMIAGLKNVSFMEYRVNIESHTSDVPVKSPLYPTNWELSTARSAATVRYFIEKGMPAKRLSATGHADTQPKVPNKDINGQPIEANRDQNQRMVIRFERIL